jgi:hypothetical protein
MIKIEIETISASFRLGILYSLAVFPQAFIGSAVFEGVSAFAVFFAFGPAT